MELVKARAETVKPGDRISTPRGVLLRVDEVTIEDGLVRILHERGYFAPVEVGERVIVQRNAPVPPVREGERREPAEARPAGEGAAAPSPISGARARALADILAGYRWPGERPREGSRRARAAEQVARHALEELSVVE